LTAAAPSVLMGQVAAEDANMAEESNEGGRGSGWWVWLWLLALPVLYVLSVGPALTVVNRSRTGKETFLVVYAPVVWLYENTPLQGPLDSYIDFWDRLTGGTP
jgi:hypothetical protein